MKTMKWLFTLCLAMMLVVLAITPAFAASKVQLNKNKVTITAGFTTKLTVRGATGTVKWSSNNSAVARVSKEGLVTGIMAGTATITAKANNQKLQCKVTVKKNAITVKKLSSLYNQGTSLYQISYHPQKLSFDNKNRLIVEGYFYNEGTFMPFDYRCNVQIKVDGKVISNAGFNVSNLRLQSRNRKSYTLTFPADCVILTNLCKGGKVECLCTGRAYWD